MHLAMYKIHIAKIRNQMNKVARLLQKLFKLKLYQKGKKEVQPTRRNVKLINNLNNVEKATCLRHTNWLK